MTGEYCLGVDWSNGAWCAVVFEDHQFTETRVFDDIESIYSEYADGLKRMCIDIPIGLFQAEDRSHDEEELVRACDAAARKAIGPRYRSVFNPPARDALVKKAEGKGYDTVKQVQKKTTGKGLQQQAYYIGDAIWQVDEFLRDHKDLVEVGEFRSIVESHPEVSFRSLASEYMEYSKRTAPGLAERIHALGSVIKDPREVFLDACDDLFEAESDAEADVDIDDVLDALALAVTASGSADDLHALPSDDPPTTDQRGLPMQIVYRADEPLSILQHAW